MVIKQAASLEINTLKTVYTFLSLLLKKEKLDERQNKVGLGLPNYSQLKGPQSFNEEHV